MVGPSQTHAPVAPSPQPVSDAVISIRGLHTQFGTHVVHHNLDLDVNRGEILGVVGGSGTGKSVLLRTIVGLTRPQAGQVHVFGTDVLAADQTQRAALGRRWGVMFQDGALFSALTVAENVEVPLRAVPGLSAAQRRALAALKIALVGLPAEAGSRYPSQLALDPELVFLDEPTAGLDPIGAAAFDALIKSLSERLGLTVFLVTHDLDTLHATCNRIAVLAEQRVLVTGTMDELLKVDHPWVQAYFHGPRARAAAGAQE